MTTKYQLKNGMNVLLIESNKSPVVAVQMWVKTGSADEEKGLEGISHFIEHLVFKGTKKYKVGEVAKAVETAGGDLNAYTSFDQTVFHVTLSKEFVDTGLDVVSQMMGFPTFDKIEIDNEREVVIEEIKRSQDNPHQQGSRLLFSTAYHEHPYRHPVLGFEKNIRDVTKEEIQKYFNARYVPQNMNLVIVGNFKTPEMKKKIVSYFGSFKKYPLKKVKRSVEPKQKQVRIAAKNIDFKECIMYLSWVTPKATHKDLAPLTLLAMILGQGDSSRLVQEIRNEKQLVNSIGSSLFSPKEPGFFAVSAALNPDKQKVVLEAIQAVIEKFLVSGPTQEEVNKSIQILESERYYSMETVDGLAGLWGHFEFLYGDYKYFDRFLKSIKKVSRMDILRTAKKYLLKENLSVSVLSNKNVSEVELEVGKWLKQFSPEQIKHESNKSVKSAKSRMQLKGSSKLSYWKPAKTEKSNPSEVVKLKSGANIIFKVIKGSPVVSARLGFLGGMRLEDVNLGGVAELATRAWGTETKTLSELEINEKIENMASGLHSFGGKNSTGLSMTSLIPNSDETFELMSDILLNPSWNDEIIEREKLLIIEQIKTRADKPAQGCMLNLSKMMFGNHPYGRDPLGGAASVSTLKAKDIEDFLSQVLNSKNLVLAVAGDFNPKEWIKKIENITERIAMSSSKLKLGQINNKISMPALSQNKQTFIETKKSQAHLALAYPGISFHDKDRYSLEILQAVLSGQGGRLFVELRDKASLAYTVAPIRMDGLESGYFGAYIGCSPEKVDTAYQMMLVEFKKLIENLVPSTELDRSKKFLTGRHDISLQRASTIADHLFFNQLYELPPKEFENYNANIQAVTAKDIQKVAERIFTQHFVLSIVGAKDVARVDTPSAQTRPAELI